MMNLTKLTRFFLKSNSLITSRILNVNLNVHAASSPLLVDIQARYFANAKTPIKKRKEKERTTSLALSDEKSAKLSKAEEEAEQKKKKQEAEKARLAKEKTPKVLLKTQVKQFEQKVTKQQIEDLVNERRLAELGAAAFKAQALIEKEGGAGRKLKKKVKKAVPATEEQKALKKQEIILTPNTMPRREPPSLRKKVVHHYHNFENRINKNLWPLIKPVQPDFNSKRTGVLGVKMGMTSLFDKWGTRHALTVIQLDRCQVVQVKTSAKEGYDALQIGVGEKNFKTLKKPEIGHYMKAGVPAKYKLYEFRVTPDCLLPVGFMLNPRHFTPGQYVDVTGVTIGKGFAGTIKRWHFHRQPATHGCSVSHRMLGSTGQRQDPGHVFKGKKMPGRLGGKPRTIQNQRIYKIDIPRSLIYIEGAVPGKPGTVLKIRDAKKMQNKNEDFLNYPTFIPQPGVEYAHELIIEPPEQDPEEVYDHDNDLVDPPAGEGK